MSTIPISKLEQILKISDDQIKGLKGLNKNLRDELDTLIARNEKLYQDWRDSVAGQIAAVSQNVKLLEEAKVFCADREALLAKKGPCWRKL